MLAPSTNEVIIDAGTRAKLVRFVALVLERTARVNLTAARSAEALDEHVRDALLLAPYVRGPLVDVGSGGGFPALVLAIATGTRCVLVESVAKKSAFLREAATALDLDVAVVTARAEDAGHDSHYRETFATATARAVGPLTTVLELTIAFLDVGGHALLQRGAVGDDERRALADAALVLGAQVEGEIPDPASATRRIVVVRKTAATTPRFPRRAGIPAKRPLCWTPRPGETETA